MKLEHLTTNDLGRHCIYLDEVDSTNEYLKREGASLPHGTLILAGCQTAGKGRLGRRWATTDRDALAMSLLLRDFDVQRLSALPLACGMAVAQGLREMTGGDFGIKWTNDVVAQGKKVCGILCESKIQKGSVSAICGIGINLNQTEVFFAQNNLPHATSLLAFSGQRRTAQAAAIQLLEELEPILEQYRQEGFSSLASSYCGRCVTLGRQVRVIRAQQEITAQAISIAPDGGLVCRKAGETFVIRAGEASVRGLYGYL